MLFNPIGMFFGFAISLFMKVTLAIFKTTTKIIKKIYNKAINILINATVNKRKRHIDDLVSRPSNSKMPIHNNQIKNYKPMQKSKYNN